MTAYSSIPLFRPEVLAARKDRLHGDISIAVPMSWQAIGYLLFLAVAVAIAFLAIASYSQVETVAGAVVIDKGTASIVTTRAGVVTSLLVAEGQEVRAGEALAHIRSEEDLAGGGTAPQRVLGSLTEQDRQLANQADMVLKAGAADSSRLAAAITGARAEIETLDRQIDDQRKLLDLAARQFADAQQVADKGFVSRHDLESFEATLLARRQQLAQLQQQRAAKATEIADSRRTIAQSQANAQAQSVAVQAQRTELEQQMAQFDAAQGYTLTAPFDGKVTALTARLGQPASQGEQLMIVVPSGGRKRVDLYVPTSAAGFLKKGQEARLAIDAFPYEQFGTVPARIMDISNAPIARQTPNGSVPVYLVTAELSRSSVRAFGREQPLMPGMSVTARIITRRQTLLEWLFEPLFAVSRR